VITGYLRDIRKQCNRNVVSEDEDFLLCVVVECASGVALQIAFRLSQTKDVYIGQKLANQY